MKGLLRKVLMVAAIVGLTSFFTVGASAVTPTPTPSVAYRLYGLDFSPYIDGQDPNQGSSVSKSQVQARMQIIAPYTHWIRTFGCGSGLQYSGEVAHGLGLQAAIGAWLSSDLAANSAQIACLINLGQAGKADMLIVGSEVLLRHDLTESQLISYINQVKAAVPGKPVATADTYSELLAHPAVVAAGDVVLANFYPYWEGIDVQQAMAHVHSQYQQLKAAFPGKPVLVSEAGWPSGGNTIGNAVPSPENASFYFLNFVSWARAEGVSYFYFEAFDETWKATYEGPQGAHWGVWDKNGNLKPGMQMVFDGQTMSNNWSGGPVGGIAELPEITEAEAVVAEPTGTNYGLWVGIATGAIASTIVLIGAAWYLRRGRLS